MEKTKSPIRSCIGCRCKHQQKTLIRFVCRINKTLEIERIEKLPGRGAYVCRSKSCIEEAFKLPQRINALLRVQLSKSVITEFKQTLLNEEIFANEKPKTAEN